MPFYVSVVLMLLCCLVSDVWRVVNDTLEKCWQYIYQYSVQTYCQYQYQCQEVLHQYFMVLQYQYFHALQC